MKMKIKEIMALEHKKEGIFLHKEGIFWRCYDYSAFLFCSCFRKYKVSVKFYKNIGQAVPYLGFPEEILPEIQAMAYTKSAEYQLSSDTLVTISLQHHPDGFEEWKMQHKESDQFDNKNNYVQIIKEIENFPVNERTPIESQNFILEIKKKLNEHV